MFRVFSSEQVGLVFFFFLFSFFFRMVWATYCDTMKYNGWNSQDDLSFSTLLERGAARRIGCWSESRREKEKNSLCWVGGSDVGDLQDNAFLW